MVLDAKGPTGQPRASKGKAGVKPASPAAAAAPEPVIPAEMNTLELGARDREKLENEMLARLGTVAGGKAVSLADLFDGHRPRWAGEALLRLEMYGLVENRVVVRGGANTRVWVLTAKGEDEARRAIAVTGWR